MTITKSHQPDIKSNWWRLVVYVFLVMAMSGVCYIPFFIFNPDLLSAPRSGHEQFFAAPLMGIANSLALSAGVILATYIMVTQIEYRSLRSIRLTLNFKELAYGAVCALVIFVLFALIGQWFGIFTFLYQGFSIEFIFSMILYFLVAVNEELFFRGYILSNFLEKVTPLWALVASSILFGLIHYGNNNFTWIGCLTISLSGLLMGLIVLKGGSLSSAVGCHWAWNFVQGPVLGFEVSGGSEHGIFKPTLLASDILTGGAFGGEGSIILAAITALIIFVIWLKLKKQGKTLSFVGD